MSSYILKKVHCKCCGNSFEGRLLKGFYNSVPVDLDGFPHNPAIFNRVVLCPACGYATDQIQAEIDSIISNVVFSRAYQEIFSSESLSDGIKRELLNAMLKDVKDLPYEAALSYLRIYWQQRESDGDARVGDVLAKAITCLSRYLEKNMDIDAAITMIDCQRQHADFTDAEETAQSLLSFAHNPEHKKLIEFELQLISSKDRMPHSQREVSV